MDFIVLSSSRGTTFQAVIEAMRSGTLQAKCLGLVTNDAENGCVQKARDAGLPVAIVERRKEESREDYDRRLDAAIRELGANDDTLLAALGWMFVFSPAFVRTWRIVNVHPALLPKYGGKGMYGMHVHEAVLSSGDAESGITIHLMDEGIDTGPILLQKRCPVRDDDTRETLRDRVQALEKEWYPKVLQMIHEGNAPHPDPLPRGEGTEEGVR